ncbi:MAG TPA: PDZ domain-containing protein [Vicinamibacterales bacterium]|nr:PDZ domain-containing protein [Vicinamibacterales bacterium]
MKIRKILTSILLVALLAVLLQIVYTRGFGLRLGAKAAPLAAPFTTEEAWVVDEIVRDITEMSAYPRSAPPVKITTGQPGSSVFRVTVGESAPIDIDLREDLWSPAAFAVLARQSLAGAASNKVPTSAPAPAFVSLVDLTPAALVAADAVISKSLASDMRDVTAHEAAAVTLAGFALREAEGRMNDTRWAMNRMTAHLAIAASLRDSGAASVDARLAEATLLALTDRQTHALAILNGLNDAKPDKAITAWTRALKMRITDDWRQLADPAHATRLEQREYFRARRATVKVVRGSVDLETLGVEPDADWARIIESYSVGVQDGWLVTDALEMERTEYQDVFSRIHGRPIDEKPVTALNTPASRCVSANAVHVLPWGAWAEFAQRHISTVIGRYDSFLRHSLGRATEAADQQAVLEQEFGALWIFPISTTFWTKGPNGREADLRYINEAVDAVLSAPHRIPVAVWAFLDFGTKYEPVRRGIPSAAAWFTAVAPRSAYDAGSRVKAGLLRSDAMTAMLDTAPYDVRLLEQYVTNGQKKSFEEIERLAGARMSYDLRPIGWALASLRDDDSRRVTALETSCRIAPGSCTDLGWELAKRGRDDEAAKAYEQAFADPALDAVAIANKSRWLMQYYATHNRVAPALQLASRVAGAASSEGLAVAGHLYEQLGRADDAEGLYKRIALGYDEYGELLGFYFRQVEVRKRHEYDDVWRSARERVFPDGLSNMPVSTDKPAAGVHVSQESDAARRIGLRAGDIIVAVDGWHVANLRQYYAARAFTESGALTLTVWRGPLAEIRIADRTMRPVFQVENYPIQGWIEH